MRLVFNLKPYSEFSGNGTKKDALNRLNYDYNMSAYPNCFSTRGDYNTRGDIRGNCAWYYTIQVYKRGKHRKAKHYNVKIYRVPFEVMDALKIKMTHREALDEVTEKWQEKYPRAMKRWYDNWDAVSPIFKFSKDVRTVIYTTNAIESLNSTYRRLNSRRSVFPSDTALLKALYLSTFEATKKWTMPIHNWGKVYGELAIMYDGRLPD